MSWLEWAFNREVTKHELDELEDDIEKMHFSLENRVKKLEAENSQLKCLLTAILSKTFEKGLLSEEEIKASCQQIQTKEEIKASCQQIQTKNKKQPRPEIKIDFSQNIRRFD
jgi:tRNA(Ile)-lysidine synthase TilS/MesJ